MNYPHLVEKSLVTEAFSFYNCGQMERYDIVIPLKETDNNPELRYTLRSIAKNFPHRKVWLSGFLPKLAKNVGYISSHSQADNKYGKAAKNIRMACINPNVTDKFFLFNDDFFIMKPVRSFTNKNRGRLQEVLDYYAEVAPTGEYYKSMVRTARILKELGIDDPLSFALHVPMLVDKRKWLDTWKLQLEHNPDGLPVQMRTLYGNLHLKDTEFMSDVKINELTEKPGDTTYLSTHDNSFKHGQVGIRVRNTFPTHSRYDK